MRHRNPAVAVALALLAACVVGCTNPYTPAGHEGYVFERPRNFGKGGFRGIVEGPGNFGVSLFRNEVINIDLRRKTYSEGFKILAKDDLNVSFQVHAVLSEVPSSSSRDFPWGRSPSDETRARCVGFSPRE